MVLEGLAATPDGMAHAMVPRASRLAAALALSWTCVQGSAWVCMLSPDHCTSVTATPFGVAEAMAWMTSGDRNASRFAAVYSRDGAAEKPKMAAGNALPRTSAKAFAPVDP